LIVIGPLYECPAAPRAPRRLRFVAAGGQPLRRIGAALAADQAVRQPAFELGFRDLDVHDRQRRPTDHEAIERHRLRDGSRKAVENETPGHVRTVEALANDTDHHLVAHELTALHDRFRAQSDFAAGLDRLPEDVAG
jgi:hypothetical protein